MYEIRMAANLHDVERAYRKPLLKRVVDAIKPGETERIWGAKTFSKQRRFN
jgi:hypothetical protein